MADHDTIRDALQQMVDAFSPYAWGSIDSKRDALNAATDALASPPVAVQEEGDAKDAARYRWLRDRPMDWSVQHERAGWSTCYGRKELDAQIDSAMKGDQP